jgi:hypothetical protein
MPKHLSSGIVAPVFVGMDETGVWLCIKTMLMAPLNFFRIFYCLKNQKMGISGKSCFCSLSQPSFFSFLGNLVMYKEDENRTPDIFPTNFAIFKTQSWRISRLFLVFQV